MPICPDHLAEIPVPGENDDANEHVKEVYARFGLAIYCAQVLEHGLVNALMFLDFVQNQRHVAKSIEQWQSGFDSFMDRNFSDTMGRMMRNLRKIGPVGEKLEGILSDALQKRNWLIHDFYRERASEFMTHVGRDTMLDEIDACRNLFERADEELEAIVTPIRRKSGLSDEQLEAEFRRMIDEAAGI